MKKKILALCLVVVLAVTAVTGATLAYFTDTEAANNVFTIDNIDIQLNEKFDEENAHVVPGANIEKNASIKNIGTTDAYVRMLIACEDTKDVGAATYFQVNEPYGTDRMVKSPTPTLDRLTSLTTGSDWLQIKNKTTGTVYTVKAVTVSEALAANAEELILKSVTIKNTADNAWAAIVGEKYEVMVLAQAAQIIEGKDANQCIDTSYGFVLSNASDAEVAALFNAYFDTDVYEAFDYTADGAWSPSADAKADAIEEIKNSENDVVITK